MDLFAVLERIKWTINVVITNFIIFMLKLSASVIQHLVGKIWICLFMCQFIFLFMIGEIYCLIMIFTQVLLVMQPLRILLTH